VADLGLEDVAAFKEYFGHCEDAVHKLALKQGDAQIPLAIDLSATFKLRPREKSKTTWQMCLAKTTF
jgi:hypothetical protein